METTIGTARLTLREFNPDIANHVFDNYDELQLVDYFGLKSNSELAAEKERHQQGFTMYGHSMLYFYIIHNELKKVIGWCGYHKWYTNHRRAELGYVLNDDQFKRKGFMSEILPVVLKYGFTKMNLHRIEAFVSPDNVPSLKLIKSAGFKEEGLLKEHYLKNQVMEDSLIFGLLQHEYISQV